MKTRLIVYEPSPGSQQDCRRMCARSLTLWCGYLPCACEVGGRAYVF